MDQRISAEVAPVRSERLELVSMNPACLRALIAGDRAGAGAALGVELPPAFDEMQTRWLPRRLQMIERDPAAQQWLTRVMVTRVGVRRAVGVIGFHEPPDPEGRVEVGYMVVPDQRGQGLATEACRALFAWARAEHGVRRFRASISPTNAPSLAVARHLGLRRAGAAWDDLDGEELVFDLDE